MGDVADPDAMEMVANRAISEFRGLDTWVNNAGIGMYGRLTQMSMADKRRLFDVNFWGVVNGCGLQSATCGGRAARSSISARSPPIARIPLLGMYSASKHAVKGYTDSLRMELEEEGAPIAVTLVKPASINTPFTEHARNYMEEEPEYAARCIHPKRWLAPSCDARSTRCATSPSAAAAS